MHIFEDSQSLRGVGPRSCQAFQALWRRGWGVGGEGRILGLLECAERERGLLCHRKRKRMAAGHEHFSAHSIARILLLLFL